MGEKITTIQLREDTRKLLVSKKKGKESYDALIRRLIQEDDSPTLEEAFAASDKKAARSNTDEILSLIKQRRTNGIH